MRRIKAPRTGAAALMSFAALTVIANPASGQDLPLSLCDPQQHTFSTTITNEFFPLSVGERWVLVGKEGSQNIGLQITVLSGLEKFYRGKDAVSTLRVEETEWEDENANGAIDTGEFIIETSINYFAETEEGTVCYFGEDVDIFQEDGSVSHEGSWLADAPDNAPGVFMPAEPQVGMSFQQEVAPGIAEDQATIVSAGKTVRTPAGPFTETIGVRDFNSLDGSRGTKSYARNVGLIQDGPLLLLSHTFV
jgi:hypothetical protein